MDIGEYDGRTITAVEVVFEGSPLDAMRADRVPGDAESGPEHRILGGARA